MDPPTFDLMKTNHTSQIRALRAELAQVLREIRAARRRPKPSVRDIVVEAAAAGWGQAKNS